MSAYELGDDKPAGLEAVQFTTTTSVSFDHVNGDTNPTESGKMQERKQKKHGSIKAKDEATLATFGKKQQLKRRFKSLSSIGLTCGLMLTWEVVLLIPLAGGPFNWVAILSPPWCKKFLSYLAGWLTVICWQAFFAEVCSACASSIQGLLILNFSDYDPKLWQATLLFYAIALFGVFINTSLGRLLPRIEALMLIMYILGFFGVLIPIVYLSPHRTAKMVFTTFQDLGGWDSMGLSFFVGWITSVSAFIGSDGADHIAEEINQASKVIPFSIWFSTLFNGVLGFSMMIAVLFSIQDIVEATQSATGIPFMEIFQKALGSRSGGNALIMGLTLLVRSSGASYVAVVGKTEGQLCVRDYQVAMLLKL